MKVRKTENRKKDEGYERREEVNEGQGGVEKG